MRLENFYLTTSYVFRKRLVCFYCIWLSFTHPNILRPIFISFQVIPFHVHIKTTQSKENLNFWICNESPKCTFYKLLDCFFCNRCIFSDDKSSWYFSGLSIRYANNSCVLNVRMRNQNLFKLSRSDLKSGIEFLIFQKKYTNF